MVLHCGLYCSRKCFSTLCPLPSHACAWAFTYFCLATDVMQESMEIHNSYGRISSLERVLTLIIPHIGQKPCICPNIDPRWSFFSQILTIPFLWHLFPYIKEVSLLWSTLILFLWYSSYFYLWLFGIYILVAWSGLKATKWFFCKLKLLSIANFTLLPVFVFLRGVRF